MGRQQGMTPKRGWPAISMVALVVVLCVYLGTGLGVAGGAHLRDGGRVFISDASQLWLGVCLLGSVVLALPRSTRWASLAPAAGYVISLIVGYLAGYRWGNFIGWKPD